MKIYADYSDYTKMYGSELNEELFKRFALEASQYIRGITFGKSERFKGEELKYATCAVVNVYAMEAEKSSKPEKRSENTDGYSVSYVVEGTDGEVREQTLDRKAYEAVRKWLLPTGLLYRGARWMHDYKC